MLNPSADRVRKNTASKKNAEIDRMIDENIHYYRSEPEHVIRARIDELDKEWDIERTLELNASVVALTGIILAARKSRKWLLLPAIVTVFLAQHAIQGWCPALPLFRRMKIRTRKEIDKEKYGLIEVLKNKEKDRYSDY